MSKGSRQRAMNKQKFNKGFDKIFNKEPDIPELNMFLECTSRDALKSLQQMTKRDSPKLTKKSTIFNFPHRITWK